MIFLPTVLAKESHWGSSETVYLQEASLNNGHFNTLSRIAWHLLGHAYFESDFIANVVF